MDNLTHSFIGLAASKAGLERLSPGTTTLCVLAANAPDSDILALVFGRWSYLQHHRGITHSIVGTLALSLALPLVFYGVDLVIARTRNRGGTVRLGGLLLASIIVSATHPLMDWTNNYGVRFLLPWNSQWFYGDLVFIIDPVFWMVLGGATFLLTSETKGRKFIWFVIALITCYLVLFGPANRGGLSNATWLRIFWIVALIVLVVLFKQQAGKRWGAKIPVVAFGVVGFYLCGLLILHQVAFRKGLSESTTIATQNNEQVIKVAAMPTLANPLHWQVLMETQSAAYRFDLSLLRGGYDRQSVVRYPTPDASNSPAVEEASRDSRTQVFLGFARFPVVEVAGEDCATQTLVQFADLRYTEPGRSRGTFTLEVPVECPPLDKK